MLQFETFNVKSIQFVIKYVDRFSDAVAISGQYTL